MQNGIDFYLDIFKEKIKELFFRCARDGVAYDEEMQILTAKGKVVDVRTAAEAVRNKFGKIIKVHGSFQDISQKKKYEAAL